MANAINISSRNQTNAQSLFSLVVRFTRTAVLLIALPLCFNLSLTSCSQADTTIAPQADTETHSAAREAASILSNESFEDTKLAKFWSPELITTTSGLLSKEQHRTGNQAMRFAWNPSQVDGTNPKLHAELATAPLTNGETERWYGYSSFFPAASMANDPNTVIVSQWHGVPDPGFSDTVPPLRFEITSDQMQVVYTASSKPIVTLLQTPTSAKTIALGTVSYDRWVDYVVHVKWDANGQTGVLQVWQDGVLKIDEQHINIGYPQMSKPYWKVGLYCWTGKAKAAERVAYCDEVRIGNATATYNDVKPGRNDNSAR